MKKIGLMTWFTYDNFGSLLQCKATLEMVKKLGYDIELINYEPRENYSDFKISALSKKVIKKIIRLCKQSNHNQIIRKNNYIQFRKEFPKSRVANEKSDLFQLNKEYDAFICGSDQIWAPTVFDENYFLSFVKDNDKKIAYAPSIGLPVIENKIVREKMKYLISQFKYLSTREIQGANIIKNLTGKDAKVVLDPTLLMTKAEWSKEFINIKYRNYILAYFLGDNKKYYKVCKQIAEKLNKKLIIIPTTEKDFDKQETIYDDLGPKEFISLINNADLILTDSFHGTIFSINFNKKFISFKRFKDDKLSQNSRIYNILEKLNLKNILYDNNLEKVLEESEKIDYNIVSNELNKLREESIQFLRDSLFSAVQSENSNQEKVITNNCTGCGVCATVCPKQCIDIELNSKGFYEYRIDNEKCIHCNLCEKVCGQNTKTINLRKFKELELYSGYSVDEDILLSSSSGGICTAIAKDYLKENENVIGCEYDNNQNIARFKVFKDLNELKKMQGSKYIQAYTLPALKELDKIDKGVIFGTPCQIASINLYLNFKKKRDNFLLVDFICHGVPSAHLWKKYINKYEDIIKVDFRDKKSGWRKKYISIKTKKSKILIPENKDYFYRFFEMSNIYGEFCYECKYRDTSLADIRVGDYWGPRYLDNKVGISMIVPITEKGNDYFNGMNENGNFVIEKTSMEDYYLYQQTKNIRIPLEYNSIINDLKDPNQSLKTLDKKYNLKKRRINNMRKLVYRIWRR